MNLNLKNNNCRRILHLEIFSHKIIIISAVKVENAENYYFPYISMLYYNNLQVSPPAFHSKQQTLFYFKSIEIGREKSVLMLDVLIQ